MKQFVLLAGLLVSSIGLYADPLLTYTTSGSFDGLGSTYNVSGGGTLTYNPGSGTGVNLPSNGSLGTIVAAGISTGGGTISNLPFTLTIIQSATAGVLGGSGSVPTATLNGTLTSNSSSVFLFFPTPSVTIGNITYTVQEPAAGIAIVPQDSNALGAGACPGSVGCGTTSIQARITGTSISAVPEPTTYGLLGSGLVGLFLMRRRKQQA